MSIRRYLLVRAAWQVGMLFVFVSLAYVVAWVVPDKALGRDPGYGGFLSNLAHGSLGRVAPVQGTGVSSRPSVDSIVWDASKVTLSLLLVTGVFAVALGALFALALVRTPRLRPFVRGTGLVFVSLLPIWTALYLEAYPGARWHLIRLSGYCPLHETEGYRCHGLGPWLASLIVPALALAIFFAGIYGRWLAAAYRAGAAEYRSDVDDGRDREEARRSVRRWHGLRFARLLSRDFAFALGFALFVEVVAGLPGLGNALVSAAVGSDAALAAGVLVVGSLLAAGVTFTVDVASAAADPRFRQL
jgi:ABC-type dipeptide/oligopeptide/nickel transport system permease component